jgi:hypothetical protein
VANFVKGYQLRELLYGSQVIKAAAVVPQSSTALFTVSGGNVLVTSLIGFVTTVFTGTATTLSMGAGSPGITIHDATILTSAALGSFVTPLVASGVATAGVVGLSTFLPTSPLVVGANINYEASAGNTGQIEWYLTYVPLDTGASVS